jgi:hypothetical protein
MREENGRSDGNGLCDEWEAAGQGSGPEHQTSNISLRHYMWWRETSFADYQLSELPYTFKAGDILTYSFKYKVYGIEEGGYNEDIALYDGLERVPHTSLGFWGPNDVTNESWVNYWYPTKSNYDYEELENGWKHVYHTYTIPETPPGYSGNAGTITENTWSDVRGMMVWLRAGTINMDQTAADEGMTNPSPNPGIQFAFADPVLYIGNPSDDPLSYTFSEETSVGQIFISDNSDLQLKTDCKLEINCGNLTGKSIEDSSGNSNKGLLIGDYKIKKTRKNRPMRRDSFIKTPKKNNNSNGAM